MARRRRLPDEHPSEICGHRLLRTHCVWSDEFSKPMVGCILLMLLMPNKRHRQRRHFDDSQNDWSNTQGEDGSWAGTSWRRSARPRVVSTTRVVSIGGPNCRFLLGQSRRHAENRHSSAQKVYGDPRLHAQPYDPRAKQPLQGHVSGRISLSPRRIRRLARPRQKGESVRNGMAGLTNSDGCRPRQPIAAEGRHVGIDHDSNRLTGKQEEIQR
jgi:hypothetical protein